MLMIKITRIYIEVSPTTGQTVLNLIPRDPYSIAMALLATLTAALLAAYQVRPDILLVEFHRTRATMGWIPGLGRIALVDAILTKAPSP